MAVSIALQPTLSGLSSPVFMTNAGDGTRRLFIVEQAGIIKVFQPVGNTTGIFLDIRTRVLSGGEQGLLGLAFHPQYAANGRFFVYYTRRTDGAIQIAEYQRKSTTEPDVADMTEKIIITIPHPGQTNHNGGMIAFGSDGFLYAGTGDGGGGNDVAGNGKTDNNAQNINELLGKIIRLNIDVAASPTILYTSPSDNPFFDPPGGTPVNGRDEIYAFGVRNPYRWSFDRGGTRQLWAGDVGQSAYEEVDVITRGGNFGWRIMEGFHCNPAFNGGVCTPPSGYISPIFEYTHAGGRCSITGGYVYRGTRQIFPSGTYIYGDYCTGEILKWDGSAQTQLLDTARNISSFGEDEDGEIYVVGLGGTVDKIVPLGPTAATVSIGGRVMTATGRGIGDVLIRLTDSSGNVRTTTTTIKSGYYNFTDVAAGETYIITAKGRRYTFSQPTQVLNIDEDASDINFIANPQL